MKILIYLKNNFWKYVYIFSTFAILGYFWEILRHFVFYHEFVNRGLFHGPVLPIYGIVALLAYIFLYRFKNKKFSLFLICGICASLYEYFGSLFLEKVYHLRWWNYYKYPFNIDGRVCLYSFIIFGLMGFIGIKFIFPYLDKQYDKLKKKNLKMFLVLFLLVYAIDMVYSFTNPNTGKSVTYDIKKTDD